MRDSVLDRISELLQGVAEDEKKNKVERTRATYLLQLMANRQLHDGAGVDREKAKKVLDFYFDKLQRLEKELLALKDSDAIGRKKEEIEALKAEVRTLAFVGTSRKYPAKTLRIADEDVVITEPLIQSEIIGAMSGGLLYESSKYVGLIQGLFVADRQGGTGTDYKQTLNAGITETLVDVDVMSEEEYLQRLGRVARTKGTKSVIHISYDRDRLLTNLENDLGAKRGKYASLEEAKAGNVRINTFFEIFNSANNPELLNLLTIYATKSNMSDMDLLRLKQGITSAKTTSEALVSTFAEKLKDEMSEEVKYYIKELKRPYAKIGQTRKNFRSRYNGKYDEVIYNEAEIDKEPTINKIITWEESVTEDGTQKGIVRNAVGEILAYITVSYTDNGCTVYEYANPIDRKKRNAYIETC